MAVSVPLLAFGMILLDMPPKMKAQPLTIDTMWTAPEHGACS